MLAFKFEFSRLIYLLYIEVLGLLLFFDNVRLIAIYEIENGDFSKGF